MRLEKGERRKEKGVGSPKSGVRRTESDDRKNTLIAPICNRG